VGLGETACPATRRFNNLPHRIVASRDLFRAHGLKRMSDQAVDQAYEPHRVGQSGMRVEGRLVDPLGVNEEGLGTARRFVETDPRAAGLGAGGFHNPHQFVTQL